MLVAIAGAAFAAETAIEKMPYPGVVAMSQERPGQWIYKSFPRFLPLYIFDGEPAGKSTCDNVCAAVWPIIQAEKTDKPMGVWTIVKRDDGRYQWAFRNKPVYMYFEDNPNDPRGAGKNMSWYLEEGALAYLTAAGVQLPASTTPAEHKTGTDNKAKAKLLQP